MMTIKMNRLGLILLAITLFGIMLSCEAPVPAQIPAPLPAQTPVPRRELVAVQTPAPRGEPVAGTYVSQIMVDGLQCSFTVHIPRTNNGKGSLPVVIMLHGGGGTTRAANEETGWVDKAEAEGFLAVFPEAMARDPSQRSSFARNPQLWNDGSGRFYPEQKMPDDIAFINALIDHLISSFPVDEKQIFVTGFSNGASMSFRAGAELSKRVAAIAPVAGACWLGEIVLEQPVSMFYMTGTNDPLNLIEGGVPKLLSGGSDPIRSKAKPPVRDSINKWVQALACPGISSSVAETNGVKTETYGPCREGCEVIYVTVEGQGHTWAGGKSLLPESWVGKTSDKIRATDAIWDFFNQHHR